jgi:hypothetical protein
MKTGVKEYEKNEGSKKEGIYPMCGEEKLPQTFFRSATEFAHGDETASNRYRVA